MNSEVKHYDAIVIGGGLGGMLVGALLAKMEKKNVLLLEREDVLGGRMHHFVGDEIHEPKDYLLPLGASTGWLVDSKPDLQTIIDKKMLHGYRFEIGMHDIINAADSRVQNILTALGCPVEIITLKAAGWWDDGKLYRMERGKMPWFNEGEYREMRAIIAEMCRMSIEEVRENHRISLAQYLEPRVHHPKVFEFFDVLGAFTVGMNSSRQLSAGEFILVTRMPMLGGMRFDDGTLGQMAGEGFMQIPLNLRDVILAHGGEVQLKSYVEKVVVEDGVARGVLLRSPDGLKRIESDIVVCNAPLKAAVKTNLIPNEHLSDKFINEVRSYESQGAVNPIFGLKKSVVDIPGMIMARIKIDDPSYPDDAVFGYEAHSLFVEGKAPEGKEVIECWFGLPTSELRALKRNNKLGIFCEAVMDFMDKSHPGFKENLEWALFPATDTVTTVAPTPAQAWDGQPTPTCTGIDNLFMVGESIRNYGKFMEGVAYGAMLCMDEITGKNYMETLIPGYAREI